MTLLPAFLDESLQRLFLSELLATPRGKATFLTQLADAEGGDGGELDIFAHVLDVLDPTPPPPSADEGGSAEMELGREVAKLVRVHKADEERHEKLFHDRAVASGGEVFKLPAESHLLRRLDQHVGFFSKPVVDKAGVVDAYLLLLVIEERAIKQFDKYAAAFAALGEDETVAVLAQIKADEARHLRYCEAISRRYSSDEAARQERLAHFRALEEKCFDEVQAMNLRILVDNGFVGHTWWTRVLWSTLSSAAEKRLPADFHTHRTPAHVAAAA